MAMSCWSTGTKSGQLLRVKGEQKKPAGQNALAVTRGDASSHPDRVALARRR